MRKAKLSIDKQIDYMKSKNIKFDICSEQKARDFLQKSNYYFKVKIFAKNYLKDANENYVNLDFAYLRKFSILDTAFRSLILDICLASEHLLKVKLCECCAKNTQDDGYEVVDEYLKSNALPNQMMRYFANKYKPNYFGYSKELLEKYVDDFAVWNFVEVLTFGELIGFYDFYMKHFSLRRGVNKFNLYAIKSLRNVAAHNSCILHTLTQRPIGGSSFNVSDEVKAFLRRNRILSSRGNVFKVPMIHDFICLIYVFNQLCPNTKLKDKTRESFKAFLDKFEEKSQYYTNPLILSRFDFIKRAVNLILS